jgi:hypothetical protein
MAEAFPFQLPSHGVMLQRQEAEIEECVAAAEMRAATELAAAAREHAAKAAKQAELLFSQHQKSVYAKYDKAWVGVHGLACVHTAAELSASHALLGDTALDRAIAVYRTAVMAGFAPLGVACCDGVVDGGAFVYNVAVPEEGPRVLAISFTAHAESDLPEFELAAAGSTSLPDVPETFTTAFGLDPLHAHKSAKYRQPPPVLPVTDNGHMQLAYLEQRVTALEAQVAAMSAAAAAKTAALKAALEL